MIKDSHGVTIAEQREEVQRLPPMLVCDQPQKILTYLRRLLVAHSRLCFFTPYCPDAYTYDQNNTEHDNSTDEA
jgi:hypothetical protein